ncbi:MAG: TldD/PmbA family protein [Bacteroidales bacterium]|nr:TldD/PmbA family protein [Bacteroidales bacterium]
MFRHSIFVYILFTAIVPVSLSGQDALFECLDKQLEGLGKTFEAQERPPYFIDFRVNENKLSYLQYSSGNLVQDHSGHNRIMTISTRVGNYHEDNTTVTDVEGYGSYGDNYDSFQLPVEDDSMAINHVIRKEIDRNYKGVLQDYKSNINGKTEKKEKKDTIPAFSKEAPSVYSEPPIENLVDGTFIPRWKALFKEISEIFAKDSNIVMNEMSLTVSNERIYYLNTEGTRIVQNRPQLMLYVFSVITTKERNLVPLFNSYVAKNADGLPGRDQLIADCNKMLAMLNELRKAPLADPYAGPSIFSPEAAGVIFHEIFGHRIEGQRMRSEFDGQTFIDKIGKKVLLDGLTLEFNPTIQEYNGLPLFGSYQYDDEGVKSKAVTVVEKGILKDFLMSRIPIKTHLQSNGHGRAQAGMAPFSRQSNLIVKFDKGETDEAMRKMLVRECKKQKKSYGYLIKEVFGGFTNTMVFSPQVFNIMPTVVYRIYTDGRPDELVRGVTFIGTPLAVFSEIIAYGNKHEVFNGFCGAESGSVPVSTISPSLLIKKIETQKDPDTKVQLPVIPKPSK